MTKINFKHKKSKLGDVKIGKKHKDKVDVTGETYHKPKLSLKNIGKIGETVACYYLKTKGHTILGQNIRLGKGEIDILSKKDGTIHLVEVKTNTSESVIKAEENITPLKKKKLFILANKVLAQYAMRFGVFSSIEADHKMEKGLILRDDPSIQIDVIAVRLKLRDNSLKSTFIRYYPSIS